MSRAFRLYHRLPSPLRSVAASVRGFQLRSWRYGPETVGLVEAALRRESWGERQWSVWRNETLLNLLRRAATSVPFYREYWSRRSERFRTTCPWEIMGNWPVLEKESVRSHPHSFLADQVNWKSMFHEHTSGTTSKPLDLWWSRGTVRAWFALFEARIRLWNGVSRNDRWGILGGQLVTPVSQAEPPFWVWNAPLKQLYLSSYHLEPKMIGAYLNAIRRYKLKYLIGYASSLFSLAQLALQEGIEPPPLTVVISNAEPLLSHQRAKIVEAFGCPVRDTYGMAEICVAGSECEAGVMHAWPEAGIVEVLKDESDEPTERGESGRFVCTGLLNSDMPLVRYDTGDRGAIEESFAPCECGRRLPVIRNIDGRADDILITPEGRRVGRLDPVFKASLGIREAQVVQETINRLRVRVVPTREFGSSDVRRIVEGLRDRMGSRVEILVERVDKIPRTSAGKFRAVISQIQQQAVREEAP